MTTYSDQALGHALKTTEISAAEQIICPHLAPTLRLLLNQGCIVTGSVTNAWSRIDREITLDRGPSPGELLSGVTVSRVSVWRNTDPHYAIAHGLRCTSCRHSLGWPARDEPLDQPDAV
ncbi:MAG: hypothetical protein HYZ17_14670 [Betaproteobacteria bacterium]|nr:hypothetical protein [Betaproteobacteria bacterium]